ncbi:hypothetical protein D3C84_435090 [compost metagenome]
MGEHQEAEADVRLLTEVTRLHEHVGQGGGQRRVGIVRIAPGEAVGQVVTLAAGVLLHDLAQIPAVAREGIGHHLVESAALPVGEDEDHREAGDQGAEQGVHQARQEQAVAVADLVEAEQHQQGDSGRGQGVAGGAGGEEHHPGNHGESRLQEGAGEQVEERPAQRQADQGAGDPLHQLAPGGAEVGLADEDRGQQYPVALLGVDQVQHAVAGGQRQAHAQGVAEHRGGGCEVLLEAFPDILQALG